MRLSMRHVKSFVKSKERKSLQNGKTTDLSFLKNVTKKKEKNITFTQS